MSITPRTLGRSNTNVRSFENFLQGWLVRQQRYLEELQSTSHHQSNSKDEEDLRDLITRVLAHYQEYYEEKSRIAHHDVFLVFSPPWFSPLERTFFWIAGVKPELAFAVVGSSVEDMSEEQVEKMEKLKAETKVEEKELGDEMARIQESMAWSPVFEVARRVAVAAAAVEEECGGEMDAAMETVKAEMEAVLANADMLRTRTAEKVAEILTAVQNVKFLATLTELQVNIRMWGSHLSR